MHHAALAPTTANLGGHVDEALDFAVHVPVGPISPIFSPLTREDAPAWRLWGDRRHGIAHQRQWQGLVQPSAPAAAGGEELVQKRSVDDPYDGLPADDEADRDAEHGEEMGEVHSAV